MEKKEKELEVLLEKLYSGKDPAYKKFIKNIIVGMSEGDKWEKLSKINAITEILKGKKD